LVVLLLADRISPKKPI